VRLADMLDREYSCASMIVGTLYEALRKSILDCSFEPLINDARYGAYIERVYVKVMLRIVVLSSLIFFPTIVLPHGGGLDGYGCHKDRKARTYHCHQGPYAGQSFSSQHEMLKQKTKSPAIERPPKDIDASRIKPK
jgi:hypothetical protein